MSATPGQALTEQVAIVAGAGGGIGSAIALALAAQGATLCLVGRNRPRLLEVAARLPAGSAAARVFDFDLTREKELRPFVANFEREHGRLDLLVHSAGSMAMGPLADAPIEDLDAQYAANVRAPYLMTQLLLPLLKAHRGQLVFINSSIVTHTPNNVGQYAATQHALKAITDVLRQELNADGIRVLSVFPGRTATPRQKRLFEMEGRAYRPELLLQPEDVAAAVVCALTLPRTAEVMDIYLRPFVRSY